ncbi:hypothetical protein BJX61DRAFT_506630 [Aspergillus egyptiacus]|nr:hypothetical protein BJX61DRAFT_506630 [Aspergillus egyptiacus]
MRPLSSHSTCCSCRLALLDTFTPTNPDPGHSDSPIALSNIPARGTSLSTVRRASNQANQHPCTMGCPPSPAGAVTS